MTWTPLTDHFIDEHLVEMFPLFDQLWLQLVNSMHPAATLPPRLVVYWAVAGLLASHRAGVMKSGVSQINSCMESCTPWAGALSRWKVVTRQVVNGWQKLLMKQGISIILAVYLCTLISKEQVGMPQTAHSNLHHHRSRERRTGSHNTSLPNKRLQ